MTDINLWLTFLVWLVVGMAITSFGMGGLVAWYGTKKTRKAGIGFMVFGLLLTVLWYYMTYTDGGWREVDMARTLVANVTAWIGAVLGLVTFLVAIIKS